MACALPGMKLGDLGYPFKGATPVRGKGEVGLALEHYFGIPPNSRAEADFSGAGIDIKVVPVVSIANGWKIKECTVISMINYPTLVDENWEKASVRKKLSILFVFVQYLPDRPKEEFAIKRVFLWHPSDVEEAFIRRDWEKVRGKVVAGRAHELSEGDGAIMGPCTKGADSRPRSPQPVTTFATHAKSRAFALKPKFTKTLFDRAGGASSEESLIANLGLEQPDLLEETVLERLRNLSGRTVGDVARDLDLPLSGGKGFAGGVIRVAAGARSARSRLEEFEKLGLTLKTVRVNRLGEPNEAMSFPAFRYKELADEEWEDSTFLSQIEGGLMLVPMVGQTKSTTVEACVIASPVLWRPASQELAIASEEWAMYRDLIRDGQANRLPGGAETRIIHVRPHARDASDTDSAPGVGNLPKKSFWLNRGFVASLIAPSVRSDPLI